MQTTEKTQRFSTMTFHQMLTLWWSETWVRNLVLLVTPVGIIDATFTMLLFNTIGADFEYNPIVRAALQTDWWIVWFVVNVFSFFVFVMMAGSYYLYTRNSLVNNRTGLVSGLIALRAALAALNVIRFYGLFPGVLGSILAGLITFIIMDGLFDRKNDISREGLKQWWRHRTDRFHDYRLTRKTKKPYRGDVTKLDEQIEREIDAELPSAQETKEPRNLGIWRKRAQYLVAAIALFIFMPYFLVFLSEITGVSAFSDIYGPLVFWNELSAPAFLLGFVAICIFVAVIMYLILRSFEVQDGAW